MYFSKEQIAKNRRIRELEIRGFNIPRFILLNQSSEEKEIQSSLSWAKEINSHKPSLFNIRTYNYLNHKKEESISQPHLCDLSLQSLESNLRSLNKSHSCMIDAEIPDNGRLAGNIAIEKSPERFQEDTIILEFVIKSNRAMVRDIEKEEVFHLSSPKSSFLESLKLKILSPETKFNEEILSLPQLLSITKQIFITAISLPKKNVILEYTYFSTPSGIFSKNNPLLYPDSHIVWWEYRTF